MYIMIKYLLLSTPHYNLCYWIWGALKLFNQIWGAAGPKSLRSTAIEERNIPFFAIQAPHSLSHTSACFTLAIDLYLERKEASS
jgi:hypothetical protein